MMMQRRQCLRWASGFFGAGLAPVSLLSHAQSDMLPELVWRERVLLGFGTTLWLKAAHTNPAVLETALDEAVAAIRQVEKQMSLFDPHSGLARLNAEGQLRNPGLHLHKVLAIARTVSANSNGAFDASTQPLWRLWAQASEHGALPSRRAVGQARARVNWRAIDASPSMIRLNLPGMQLSLNGIAQGYASDLVRTILHSHGIRHAQIDTGETALLGQAPDGRAWTFDIEDAAGKATRAPPVLIPEGRAIATSSQAHTAFSADHRHHHIMDPHTGYSPTYWSSVTVIAQSCTLADALTKVFFMLPPTQVLPVARQWGVDVVLQDKAGSWMSTV